MGVPVRVHDPDNFHLRNDDDIGYSFISDGFGDVPEEQYVFYYPTELTSDIPIDVGEPVIFKNVASDLFCRLEPLPAGYLANKPSVNAAKTNGRRHMLSSSTGRELLQLDPSCNTQGIICDGAAPEDATEFTYDITADDTPTLFFNGESMVQIPDAPYTFILSSDPACTKVLGNAFYFSAVASGERQWAAGSGSSCNCRAMHGLPD